MIRPASAGRRPGLRAGEREPKINQHQGNSSSTISISIIHYPKYDDNMSFQGLLKFAPT